MLERKKQLFLTRCDYRSITFRVVFGIYDLFRGRARPRAVGSIRSNGRTMPLDAFHVCTVLNATVHGN